MATVVLDPKPPELEQLLDRRRRLGLDRFDEVWEGDYHMVPGPGPDHAMLQDEVAAAVRGPAKAAGLIPVGQFNLGEPNDYRVPDGGILAERWTTSMFVPTALLVVEVVSPNDETWAKFGFYATREVRELVVADPTARSIAWFERRDDDRWMPTGRSQVLDGAVDEILHGIEFPT